MYVSFYPYIKYCKYNSLCVLYINYCIILSFILSPWKIQTRILVLQTHSPTGRKGMMSLSKGIMTINLIWAG